jgi:pyrophosphate--fructose-6-phosphate 1-phosphotransferase
MLVVHEVMGRNCGWLTGETARRYHGWVASQEFAGFGDERRGWDVHGVYVPELGFDIDAEAQRLRGVMDEIGCVNLFVSEGAGVETIVGELQARGEEVQRDAFGHVKLDTINPGAWFGKQFAERLGAEKTMVQKSGYFSRSAPANSEDLALIRQCTDLAAEVALDGGSGVIGQDEERGDELRAIEFARIKGGKPFDTGVPWFRELLADLGQPLGTPVAASH